MTAAAGISVARQLRRNKADDQNHEQGRDQESDLNFLERCPDGGRPVRHYRKMDIRGNDGSKTRKLGLQCVNDLNDICGGLAANDDRNRSFAVEQAHGPNIFGTVIDLSNIGQSNRSSVAPRDHRVAIIGGITPRLIGIDLPAVTVGIDHATWAIGAFGLKSGANIFERNSILSESRGFTSTRTEGRAAPPSSTFPTPWT